MTFDDMIEDAVYDAADLVDADGVGARVLRVQDVRRIVDIAIRHGALEMRDRALNALNDMESEMRNADQDFAFSKWSFEQKLMVE